MKGGKAKKSAVERSNKSDKGSGRAEKSEGPHVTSEMHTVSTTLCFGSDKQRKVYPPRMIPMQRLDLHSDRIHVMTHVLLPEECEYFISWGEERGFEEFKQAASREYAHRENGRIQVDDAVLAQRIYERMALWLPPETDRMSPKGCSSNIRLYRYTEGQSFGKHIDEAHPDRSLGGVTKYTLLIYLSGHTVTPSTIISDNTSSNEECVEPEPELVNPSVTCTGGETVFYQGHSSNQVLLSVAPEQGKMLLHGHGVKCLTHEGSAVTSGVKYVLRTDVVYSNT